MGFFDAFKGDHDAVHHKGSFTHDAIAGAAAYEATKAYEEHCAKNGKPDSHAKAKEIFAGFAAAAITQIVETKGIDAWDAHKQKEVEKKAHQRFEEVVIAREY